LLYLRYAIAQPSVTLADYGLTEAAELSAGEAVVKAAATYDETLTAIEATVRKVVNAA
jgi:hypothetical protein